jgi:hypothetical protein
MHAIIEELFSVQSVLMGYKEYKIELSDTHVEAGLNTSTVTLRDVEGYEMGSFIYETVKYGHESLGTRTQERLQWQGPAAYTKDRPVLLSERAIHKKQDRNCQTVINMWS